MTCLVLSGSANCVDYLPAFPALKSLACAFRADEFAAMASAAAAAAAAADAEAGEAAAAPVAPSALGVLLGLRSLALDGGREEEGDEETAAQYLSTLTLLTGLQASGSVAA